LSSQGHDLASIGIDVVVSKEHKQKNKNRGLATAVFIFDTAKAV